MSPPKPSSRLREKSPKSVAVGMPATSGVRSWGLNPLPVVRDERGQLLQLGKGDRDTLAQPREGNGLQDKFEASASGQVETARPSLPVDAAKAAELEALHRLVYACMNGESAAWQRLVSSQHRRIYAICYRFTGSPTDAEDLTQEVFLKVYRNLQGFDPEKGAFTTWLTALTRNLLVDYFRRTRQDRATDSLDASLSSEENGATLSDRLADARPGPMQMVAQQEMRARIQLALKKLSPELREAVILRDLQDMDYKDIAAVLRVPEGTVKSRISRGRAELARALGRNEKGVM